MVDMNDLELYTRTWGAMALPFDPLSYTLWVAIPSHKRALTLLQQTVALRGVKLLSGGNGMGKSTLVGRWVRQLENRLYSPVNQAIYRVKLGLKLCPWWFELMDEAVTLVHDHWLPYMVEEAVG